VGRPARPATAAVRIELSDPDLVADLLGVLSTRPDCIATQRNRHAIDVSLVGSFADGGALELTLMVRAWQAAHPGVEIELY
jgi:hypothetical protein